MTRPSSGDATAIENARVVTPDRVIPAGHVRVESDRITSVGQGAAPAPVAERVDADGAFVVPGFVDLHGDDVERHCFPRDEARVRLPTALTTCDRENVAAGVTTKFDAVAFEEAPGKQRSLERADRLVRAIAERDDLLVDHRVHVRCEVGDGACVDRAVEVLDRGDADLASLVRHVPGEGQFADRSEFERRYADGGTSAQLDAVVERRRGRAADVPSRIDRLAGRTRAAAVPLASHDDERPESVGRMYQRGVRIVEFPVTLAAARRASELGMTTTMGAPNLVRGGSLWDNLDAREAMEAGVVDALCSDYHPYSLLESIFVDEGSPLPERVRRVTEAPADAVGLVDRGRLEPGARADLLVVKPDSPPVVCRTFVGGTEVYRAGRFR